MEENNVAENLRPFVSIAKMIGSSLVEIAKLYYTTFQSQQNQLYLL